MAKLFYELFIENFTKHLDPLKFLKFSFQFTFDLKSKLWKIYL